MAGVYVYLTAQRQETAPVYLRADAAAEYLGVSVRLLWRWVRAAELPGPDYDGFGRLLGWRVAVLQAWVAVKAARQPCRSPVEDRPVIRPGRKACRHCQRHEVNRPRGLCWSCYYTPEIRTQYPSKGRVGHGVGVRRARLPPVPTTALPGSPQKIAVLEARARQRFQLFHPQDR